MVVPDRKRYQRTIDSLLNHLDFKTVELIKDSSTKWVQRSYAVVKASHAVKDGWDWEEMLTGIMERAAEESKEEEAMPLGVKVFLVRRRGSDVLIAGLASKKEGDSGGAASTANVLCVGGGRMKDFGIFVM